MESRYLPHPYMMNLELTTKCPLRCPQCYVGLDKVREMPLDTALYWLREGAKSGVKQVNLSGGETLAYPHLDRLLTECVALGMDSAVALSGAYVNRDRLQRLIATGVNDIFISLNGSTEEINSQTRDGYGLAIKALELLQELDFKNRWINFVMHKSNAEDLPQMVALGEKMGVTGIVILVFKPDAAHELPSYPTAAQLRSSAKFIKAYQGPLELFPEPCFSPLLALVEERFFLNRNVGIDRGCGAGRDALSVTTEGLLTPCRHLDVPEKFPDMMSYWQESEFLSRLRAVEDRREKPCRGCHYENNCLPCMAVMHKMYHGVLESWLDCPLASETAKAMC